MVENLVDDNAVLQSDHVGASDSIRSGTEPRSAAIGETSLSGVVGTNGVDELGLSDGVEIESVVVGRDIAKINGFDLMKLSLIQGGVRNDVVAADGVGRSDDEAIEREGRRAVIVDL